MQHSKTARFRSESGQNPNPPFWALCQLPPAADIPKNSPIASMEAALAEMRASRNIVPGASSVTRRATSRADAGRKSGPALCLKGGDV